MTKRRISTEDFATISLVLLFLFGVTWFACSWFTTDRGMKIIRLQEEPTRLASGLFFSKMTAIGQLTIALLGATWAILAVHETKVTLAKPSAVISFALTNFSFLLSLLAYNRGYDFLVRRIFHHQAFDIDAPFVSLVNIVQQTFFIFGCLTLVCTILFGRKTS